MAVGFRKGWKLGDLVAVVGQWAANRGPLDLWGDPSQRAVTTTQAGSPLQVIKDVRAQLLPQEQGLSLGEDELAVV